MTRAQGQIRVDDLDMVIWRDFYAQYTQPAYGGEHSN